MTTVVTTVQLQLNDFIEGLTQVNYKSSCYLLQFFCARLVFLEINLLVHLFFFSLCVTRP